MITKEIVTRKTYLSEFGNSENQIISPCERIFLAKTVYLALKIKVHRDSIDIRWYRENIRPYTIEFFNLRRVKT